MNDKKETASEMNKLMALNEELENYFRNTIIPQLYVDANLVLRKFTPPAMKQFELTSSDLGKHIDEISHHIRFPTFLENINEVIRTGTDLEKEIQTTDMKWFQMNILPYITDKNKSNGVIITFVNITDRIKNLKELEKLNMDHETFIHTVSHDIKGPLFNIEGLVEHLTDLMKDTDAEYKKIVDMINLSVNNIKKIVNDLTDITRTRHNITNGAERVNIENILEEVLLTLKDMTIRTKAKITTEINVSEFNFIRKNLRSIVYNLLSNALKYRDPNRTPEVFIKTENMGAYNVLSITDNGIGIDDSDQKTIFSEFSRIPNDEHITGNVEGTGVGLYIISKMIENTDGKIEVESILGQGTTFSVFFPTNI